MTPTKYITSHEAELVTFLQKLIRICTVNPPGKNYSEITSLLAATLFDLGLEVRRIEIPRSLQRKTQPQQLDYPRYNVIGFLEAGAKKTIHFNAHYDVVPVSGTWKHGNAFNPAVDRSHIYGRGTADMKGAIASIVQAIRALRATGTEPLCNLEVSFTADEETDSVLGTEWVVHHGKLRADYAIVCEGGQGDAICCGHNGVIWLDVLLHGKAAHGSTPERGINALEKMAALVLAMDDYKKTLASRTFPAPKDKLIVPTLNVGGFFRAGEGSKINTVPAFASFTIDRRVPPAEDIITAQKDLCYFLKKAAAKIPDCRIKIEKVLNNSSCYCAPTTSFYHAVEQGVAHVRRRPAYPTVSAGFNDMFFFANHLKIPTVSYGPGGSGHHALDERAKIKDLANAAKIYTHLATTFIG